MSFAHPEQIRHDRVNLVRLLRRLEGAVESKEWQEEMRSPTRATWIKTQGMLEKVKFARRLLKNVELHHALEDSSASTRLDQYEDTIDKLEAAVGEAHKKAAPQTRRPVPILPTLPLPVLSVPTNAPEPTLDIVTDKSPEQEAPTPAASGLWTSSKSPAPASPPAQASIDPAASLIPANAPSTSSKPSLPSGAPAFLQNSASLQEEMSEQLAQMAAQLKRNAMHFANSLEKDKAVVEDAHGKMERNFDVLSKERVRLRDHRSKSWGTTWLVMLSMLVAAIGFVLTFFVIRIT